MVHLGIDLCGFINKDVGEVASGNFHELEYTRCTQCCHNNTETNHLFLCGDDETLGSIDSGEKSMQKYSTMI